MIKENNFFVKDLDKVVIIGASPNIEKIFKINSSLKLKTLIVTSSNQKNYFNKNNEIHIFKELIGSKFENFIKKNCEIEKTLFLSISSMFIFKSKTIKFLKNNLINYFPSRLPLDSGRGGFSWHIMREDRILNNLFHIVDEGINTGPIISSEANIFPSSCKIPLDFENFKWDEMNNFYFKFIKKLKNGNKFIISKQQDLIGRNNPSLNTFKNGFIDWSLNSYDLYNFINAFDDPHQGASTFLNRPGHGRLFIKKIHLHGGDTSNHPYFSGIVSRHDGKWITVCTSGKHMFLIEQIFNSKGKNIINKIKVGDRFHTPSKFIEGSKSNQTFYKP